MARFAKREYQLELVTPAFLGGADQSAQWRTAGLKTLLRQWWRVVWAAENPHKTVNDMRIAEAHRFGSVQDGVNCKAHIQIRFAEKPNAMIRKIDFLRDSKNNKDDQTYLYLGYGAFTNDNQPSKRTAIDKLSKIKFNILIHAPDEQQTQLFAQEIDETMSLIHQFGTVGSRANNAWGSLHVSGDLKKQDLKKYSLSLAQCLKNDWKKAIASDQQGLMIWHSAALSSTEEVMKKLKNFRKEGHNGIAKQYGQRPLINAPVKGSDNRNPSQYGQRPLINALVKGSDNRNPSQYGQRPLINALVKGSDNRNPSQYVLKVLKEGNRYRGQITLLAHQWCNDTRDLMPILTQIAQQLDQNNSFNRIAG